MNPRDAGAGARRCQAMGHGYHHCDPSNVISALTTEHWLIAAVVVAGGIYVMNRSKPALLIALSAAIYLLPFLFDKFK